MLGKDNFFFENPIPAILEVDITCVDNFTISLKPAITFEHFTGIEDTIIDGIPCKQLNFIFPRSQAFTSTYYIPLTSIVSLTPPDQYCPADYATFLLARHSSIGLRLQQETSVAYYFNPLLSFDVPVAASDYFESTLVVGTTAGL